MHSWEEFERDNPALAENGKAMFFQFGTGLAFLATTRKDGGPRVHPVCPLIDGGQLYLLILAASPKRRDLERDGRFALHSFPAPDTDNEFYCSGRAERIDDSELWNTIASLAKHDVDADEVLFRLEIDKALYTTWKNPRQPNMKPIYKKWSN